MKTKQRVESLERLVLVLGWLFVASLFTLVFIAGESVLVLRNNMEAEVASLKLDLLELEQSRVSPRDIVEAVRISSAVQTAEQEQEELVQQILSDAEKKAAVGNEGYVQTIEGGRVIEQRPPTYIEGGVLEDYELPEDRPLLADTLSPYEDDCTYSEVDGLLHERCRVDEDTLLVCAHYQDGHVNCYYEQEVAP